MCGIVGIVGCEEDQGNDAIEKMMHSVRHRGPDDEGKYYWETVAFGHKRLAIIDPKGGSQPMTSRDDSLCIVFNGAIYNYLELRQELIARGHTFETYSDTEVLLHIYSEYGEECLDKLNGMFAFVLLDKRKRRIFAARDRFGIKPFYYCATDNAFIFASEPKALFASEMIVPDLNPAGMRDYLVFQYTLGEKTLFHNVKKLEPGHSLTFSIDDPTTFTIRRWWNIRFAIDTHHTEEYFIDRLQYLVRDSVNLRMRADVPVGAFLSGGIDSSAVATIAAESLAGATFHTFTGLFAEGKEFDESEYAKTVATASKTAHHEITITAQDFLNDIEHIIWCMDEPGAGPGVLPQYCVCRLASEFVKVVMGGQGGDEIFIGYARYLVAYLEEVLHAGIFNTADGSKYVATLTSLIPNLPMLRNYIPMLGMFWQEGLFESQERRYFRLIDRSEGIKSLFDPMVFNAPDYDPFEAFCEIFDGSDAASYVNKMTYFDLKASLPALLHVDDRTGMAFGLESRLPLLDYRIAELVASMPPQIKFEGGALKAFFKKAMRNILPSKILDRKDKMGFPVPIAKWYHHEIKDYVYDTIFSHKALNRGIYNKEVIEKLLNSNQSFSRVIWGGCCVWKFGLKLLLIDLLKIVPN